jgi:hypothetical protein
MKGGPPYNLKNSGGDNFAFFEGILYENYPEESSSNKRYKKYIEKVDKKSEIKQIGK